MAPLSPFATPIPEKRRLADRLSLFRNPRNDPS
jgi:hypothetical protein